MVTFVCSVLLQSRTYTENQTPPRLLREHCHGFITNCICVVPQPDRPTARVPVLARGRPSLLVSPAGLWRTACKRLGRTSGAETRAKEYALTGRWPRCVGRGSRTGSPQGPNRGAERRQLRRMSSTVELSTVESTHPQVGGHRPVKRSHDRADGVHVLATDRGLPLLASAPGAGRTEARHSE